MKMCPIILHGLKIMKEDIRIVRFLIRSLIILLDMVLIMDLLIQRLCLVIRHTNEWKKIYPQRKQTIERVFADAKENHGMRFTHLRGIQKNQHESLIIFRCHNLKKLGLSKQRIGQI